MTVRRDTRSDAAFTMIEMIVVLVVMALAMATIFPAIGNMLRGSTRSSAMSQASSEAAFAARLIESDVRRALGDRGTGERTDTYDFSGASAIQLATIPALTSGNQAYVDIISAGPQRLLINANVFPTAGIERVEWRLQQNQAICGDRDRATGSNWCLTRTVTTSAGGPLTFEVPVRGRGTYPVNTTTCAPSPGDVGAAANTGRSLAPIATPRVFCYQEGLPSASTNPADNPIGMRAGSTQTYINFWSPTCVMRWNATGVNANTAQVTMSSVGAGRFTTRHNAVDGATTSIHVLDRIVNVNATILGGGAYGRASERSYEHVSVAIRSRESEAYREAIMCGSRAGWGR